VQIGWIEIEQLRHPGDVAAGLSDRVEDQSLFEGVHRIVVFPERLGSSDGGRAFEHLQLHAKVPTDARSAGLADRAENYK